MDLLSLTILMKMFMEYISFRRAFMIFIEGVGVGVEIGIVRIYFLVVCSHV